MNCKQCGNKIEPDDKFCAQCGQPVSQDEKESKDLKTSPGALPSQQAPETPAKKNKRKKASIIAGSVCGSILAIAAAIFILVNFFNFPILQFAGIGGDLWQYERTIKEPITAVIDDEDITLGQIETHGVSVHIPSQAFDSQASVTLSHPDKKPHIDAAAFVPLGAPVSIESTGGQERLNRAMEVTLSIDRIERDRSGALFIATLNERNRWDYIIPDKVDLQKKTVTFTTHRLGTYGFVNMRKEKLVEEFSRRRSVRQWTEKSLVFEAGQARDEIVREILQDRLGILDSLILDSVSKGVAIDCPADKLAQILVDRNAGGFTDMVASSAGRHIPVVVETMVLKEALENAVSQSWAPEEMIKDVSEILGQGNLTQATIRVIESVNSEFLVTRVSNIWVTAAEQKIGVWNNIEIEKAYEVYRGGSQDQGPLWGFKAQAGNFDEIWDQMKGLAEDLVEQELKSYVMTLDKKPEELVADEKNKIRDSARQKLKQQFEDRLQHEEEIKLIENKNIRITGFLGQKGLMDLSPSNPSFEEQDDLASLIGRLYETIEQVKRDTGRYEIISQADEIGGLENFDPQTMIHALDLVELVYKLHDGEREAYMKAIEELDLQKIETEEVPQQDVIIAVEEPVNMSLDDVWQSSAGTIVKINGNSGVFQAFSPTWQEFADAGFIKIGDLQIKDIVKISDNQWSCSVRYWFTLDEEPYEVGWSDKATITMSDDGTYYTSESEATHPKTGELFTGSSTTYYRASSKIAADKTGDEDIEEEPAETVETEEEDRIIRHQDRPQDEKDIEQQEQLPLMILDGKWASGSFSFEIIQRTGYFYSLAGKWQEFADAGFIKIGDPKIKDIIQIGHNKWKCAELYWFTMDNKPYAVGWSDEATITMSDDGKSITIESKATHPGTGNAFEGSGTYKKS